MGGGGGFVGQACTAIGNTEGVSVDFTTALPFEGGDYAAEVSVPALGASRTIGFAGNDGYGLYGDVEADLDERPVTVDVRVVTERGDVAFEGSTVATPVLHQPNGAACDGENHRIGLRATRDGSLVPTGLFEEPRDEQGRVSLVVFTPCGVSAVTHGYDTYARVGGVLGDGAGGPPPGWNVPDQRGWAAIEGDTLTFQDERGHTEVFQRQSSDVVPGTCGG